jgi:hypothetical protein
MSGAALIGYSIGEWHGLFIGCGIVLICLPMAAIDVDF